MKKILALILAALMLFGAVPAFAADGETAARDLGQYGIMNGDPDGNLRLNDPITRAEFAKMIMVAKTAKTYAPVGYSIFGDVDPSHWASGYIMEAADLEIINGIGNDLFAPGNNVTHAQAVKMVIGALGYGDIGEDYGGYPTGYYTVMHRLGFRYQLPLDEVPATRAEIAMFLSEAMDMPVREKEFLGYVGYERQYEITIYDGKDGRELRTFRTIQEQ